MLKDFARRLFFCRSTAYFLFSFLSACAQVILRTALFVIDDDGSRRKGVAVYPLPLPENVTRSLYSLLSDGGFESCPNVPAKCQEFKLAEIVPEQALCAMLASYTANLFRDNRLEDIIFIILHIYLVLVSVYTLARESIPHVIFIFTARCLSAVWSLGRFIQTFLVQKTLLHLVDHASCGSETEFFGQSFFAHRHSFEAALLGASVLSIILESHVAYKLGRVYSERPWRVVQVSSEMRRMYRILLGFSVVTQMAGVVLPALMGLWVDQLLNTNFKLIVGDHRYLTASIEPINAFIKLLPSWIALGWFALRREWKRSTWVFLCLGMVFLSCLIAGFASAMFRWTFTTWWFFDTLYCVSLVLLIAAIVLAFLCRRNFDKNLDHDLMVQSRLSAIDFAHAHFEKDRKLDEGQVPEVLETISDCRSEYGVDFYASNIKQYHSTTASTTHYGAE